MGALPERAQIRLGLTRISGHMSTDGTSAPNFQEKAVFHSRWTAFPCPATRQAASHALPGDWLAQTAHEQD
jgi:hypothetical protein